MFIDQRQQRNVSLTGFHFHFSASLTAWKSPVKPARIRRCVLTGQRTTLHTDKCTDRIIRLCTSVALDGLNLTEKLVVCIVSILKYSRFSTIYPLKHFFFFFFTQCDIFVSNRICRQVCLLKGNMCFRDSAGGSYASNITSPLAQTSEWRVFRKRSKGSRGALPIQTPQQMLSVGAMSTALVLLKQSHKIQM